MAVVRCGVKPDVRQRPARDMVLASRYISQRLLSVGVGTERQIFVERLPDVFRFEPQWRATVGRPSETFPEVEVAENLLDDRSVLNKRDRAHLAAALGAEDRVNVPSALDQFAPGFGWDTAGFVGRPLRLPCIVHGFGRRQAGRLPYNVLLPGALAAGFVAVVTVVLDRLRTLFRDMLRDGGEEVGGGEHPSQAGVRRL